eukprot:TRINITY_DN1160_c0_g1_i7.p1 TRINITY_DN1160_c0_g1~~TRINITY_DN1160_c0_g1_i7.p1  ORF type:complete len:307 (+),score=53.46 TRINITY_DN1160_c0_g1_i7:118-1038(+)
MDTQGACDYSQSRGKMSKQALLKTVSSLMRERDYWMCMKAKETRAKRELEYDLEQAKTKHQILIKEKEKFSTVHETLKGQIQEFKQREENSQQNNEGLQQKVVEQQQIKQKLEVEKETLERKVMEEQQKLVEQQQIMQKLELEKETLQRKDMEKQQKVAEQQQIVQKLELEKETLQRKVMEEQESLEKLSQEMEALQQSILDQQQQVKLGTQENSQEEAEEDKKDKKKTPSKRTRDSSDMDKSITKRLRRTTLGGTQASEVTKGSQQVQVEMGKETPIVVSVAKRTTPAENKSNRRYNLRVRTSKH